MTEKQILNIKTLYESVGSNVVFGRGRVCDVLGCAGSTATSLLAKMRSAGIVEAVTGQGKGKYKFKWEIRDNYIELVSFQTKKAASQIVKL